MGKLFLDIVGQNHAVKILTAQLESNQISHAYLFLGDEGIGKEYLAKEFSKYLLCPKNANDDCTVCKNFEKGVHPDFIFINGKEGIKIEQVREAIERVNLSPSIGERKVLYLSKAENLGIEAANALLKTLEEPPLDSIIIITALSEKTLPETILSRSQKIKLNPLGKEDLRKILSKNFTDEEIEKVIDFCEGNVGEAHSLLHGAEKIKEKKGAYEDIEILLNSQSVIEKFKIIEKYDKTKNLRSFFDLFSKTIYDLVGLAIKGEKSNVVSVASKYDISALTRIALKTLKIYENLEYNVNLKIAMEEIVLENSLNG